MVELGVPEYRPDGFRCEIRKATPSDLPRLRNFLMGSLPCWGVKEVRFNENSSTLHDERVADRLGMIPFGVYDEKKKPAVYHLNVANGTDNPHLAVTSAQMTLVEGDPLNFPNVIITYLQPGRKIDLYVVCDQGVGLEHYRYSAVSAVFYEGKTLVVECLEGVNPEDVFRELLKMSRP